MSDTEARAGNPGAPGSNNEAGKPRMRSRLILLVCLVLILGAAVYAVWRSETTPRGVGLIKIVGDGTNENPGILTGERKQIGSIIWANYEEYRDNTRRWSSAYFSCLFLSAVFSALAGFVIKLKAFGNASAAKEDLAALLAMLAALLITLSTVGDFQRKWHANRIAASDTEALVYDLIKPDMERGKLISRLKEISLNRNREIVGDTPGTDAQQSRKGK